MATTCTSVAMRGFPPGLADVPAGHCPAGPETGVGRRAGREASYTSSTPRTMKAIGRQPRAPRMVDIAGGRTLLAVPMQRTAIARVIYDLRREVRPFEADS